MNIEKSGYNLKKYHPVALNDLVRIGRIYDGGYLLSEIQIAKTDTLLSFGISDDWSFEADFLERKKAKLYAYDHSVSASVFKEKSAKYFLHAVAFALSFKFSKARAARDKWSHFLKRARDFNDFFREGVGRVFSQKFIGPADDETYISFDTIFKGLASSPDLSVFVKMDIENWEYRTLPQLRPYFEKINGLVVEFHELDIAGHKFEEIMEVLSDRFYVGHIHANNFGGLIHGTTLPNVLEITFINKLLVPGTVSLSKHTYPIPGLDFPCNEKIADIGLEF